MSRRAQSDSSNVWRMALWWALPHETRTRVHLACTPMADPDVAVAIVNAVQRDAAVVVQKSLAEGFGLTVAEARWKGRRIVASAVGGISDQIDDGVSSSATVTSTSTAPSSDNSPHRAGLVIEVGGIETGTSAIVLRVVGASHERRTTRKSSRQPEGSGRN